MGKIITDETGQQILEAIKKQDTILQGMQGTLSSLKTKNKTSLVASINDVYDAVASNTETLAKHTTSITTLDSRTELLTTTNINYRNSVGRFKDLGTELTDAQRTAITSNTLDDLFVGDHWTINDHKYYIAGFTTRPSGQNVGAYLIMLASQLLTNGIMNETATNEGGYLNSYMHNTFLPENATPILQADWGTLLKTFSTKLTRTNGSGWVQPCNVSDKGAYGLYCMLPTHRMIYGHPWAGYGQDWDAPMLMKQLPLFQFASDYTMLSELQVGWLQDCANSSSQFLTMSNSYLCGLNADALTAGESFTRVSPIFFIG